MPVSVGIITVIVFIGGGAVLFSVWEGWNLFDGKEIDVLTERVYGRQFCDREILIHNFKKGESTEKIRRDTVGKTRFEPNKRNMQRLKLHRQLKTLSAKTSIFYLKALITRSLP
jgi:hypothetical protein